MLWIKVRPYSTGVFRRSRMDGDMRSSSTVIPCDSRYPSTAGNCLVIISLTAAPHWSGLLSRRQRRIISENCLMVSSLRKSSGSDAFSGYP